jgi:hypothetical protein
MSAEHRRWQISLLMKNPGAGETSFNQKCRAVFTAGGRGCPEDDAKIIT